MKKTIQTIGKYFIELFIVAFGVFLGFYLNNLSAENKIKQEKHRTLEIIITELQNNAILIKNMAHYHEGIKAQMSQILPKLKREILFSNYMGNKEFNFNQLKGWNGFNFARVETTAFEGAKMSGIFSNFNIKTIQEISAIYQTFKVYNDFGVTVLNKGIATNSSTKVVDFVITIELMTGDLLLLEYKLESTITSTIAALKKELKR